VLKKTLALACLSLSMGANAASITLVGDTVNYVYDDAQAAVGLFGLPTIVGDVVRFTPPSFRAESTNGAGIVNTSANFIFSSVYSTNGFDLAEIRVIEDGDYDITGGDSVKAALRLTISNNDDVLEFTNSLVTFNAAGDSGGPGNWGLSTALDPQTEFGSPITDIEVSIQNTLTASTDALGESAWIQKKLSFVASTTVVPVPAAAWLFGSALLGLGLVKRRK